jgi:hypothetical protein
MALDRSLSRPVACFYADAALGLRAVLAGRERQWLDLLADPVVPPSWEVAVDALRPGVKLSRRTGTIELPGAAARPAHSTSEKWPAQPRIPAARSQRDGPRGRNASPPTPFTSREDPTWTPCPSGSSR